MPVGILTAVLSVVYLHCMHDYVSLLSATTKPRTSSNGSCVCKLVGSTMSQWGPSVLSHDNCPAQVLMLRVCVMQDGTVTETLVPSGAYNIAFARTPVEVLAIVYLGSPSTPGGFFPNGVNGNIQG